MTKPIYITEWKDLVGETIERVYVEKRDNVCITMISGKRVFITTDGWDDHYPEIDIPSIDDKAMLDAGWMSQKDYDERCNNAIKRKTIMIEQQERAEYLRLKEKFEKGE